MEQKQLLAKTVNAYCISSIDSYGSKSYLFDVKYWTKSPIEADFYEDIKDAEEDLERCIYGHTITKEYIPEHEIPDFKIEKVTITFEED